LVHYRPFGGGQGAFEITAMLVGGLRAGKMDGTVPNGGFPCRRVIEGVLIHGRLVEPGGGKWFTSPVLVKDDRGQRRGFAKDHCKLGKNRFGKPLLMVALHRGNAEKAGQSVGALAVVGTVMDLSHGTAFAETIARQARLPPERFLVKGTEFRMTRHPRPHSQHRLGQIMRQVGSKENGGSGKARRQGKDYLAATEPDPGLFFQLADADQSAGGLFFDGTDRVIEPDGVFRNMLTEFCDQCRHAAGKPPAGGLHGVPPDGMDGSIWNLITAHTLFKLAIPLESQGLNKVRHFRVNVRPVPGGAKIGEKPVMFTA